MAIEYPDNCGVDDDMKVDGKAGIGESNPDSQLVVNAPDTVDIADFRNGGTSKLIVKESGKVGIGTSAPYRELELHASGCPEFRISSDRSNDGQAIASIEMAGKNDAATPETIIYGRIDGEIVDGSEGTEDGQLRFYTQQEGSLTNQMIIESSGNVGIGIDSPGEKLDVNGKVRADDYIEYSKTYTGNAIEKIKTIKPESGQNGEWQNIDHNTLPEGVRYEKKLDNGDIFVGRNLGNSVQLNLKAIQQLCEIIEKQQEKIEELEKKSMEGVSC